MEKKNRNEKNRRITNFRNNTIKERNGTTKILR
jgi:hypothetical protein